MMSWTDKKNDSECLDLFIALLIIQKIYVVKKFWGEKYASDDCVWWLMS